MSPVSATLLSVVLVSVISLAGVSLLALHEAVLRRILLALVSFSTGAMLGTVFLHLMPEIREDAADFQGAMFLVLLGMLLSFAIEKCIHWHHHHDVHCEHVHPAGPLVLIGDGVHNALDGILIAAAYLVSIPTGIAATIAVAIHEIPQELGDFSVLLYSGYSKGRALLWNFLSASTAIAGAALTLSAAHTMHGAEGFLLPIAAGHFLCVAGADLIPELHKETHLRRSILQLAVMVAGIALMYGVSVFGEGVHERTDSDRDEGVIEKTLLP